MNVLIVGTSMAGGLYRAITGGLFKDESFEPNFFVISGGTGPYLRIRNGLMEITMRIEAYPPYCVPEGADKFPLNHWDVIVISALGLVDSGLGLVDPIKLEGLAAEFDPIMLEDGFPLVSQSCLKELIVQGLRQQHGIRFLKELRTVYQGRIIIQPFPLPSANLKGRSDWVFGSRYRDRLGAHRFICSARDEAMKDLSAETGAVLLDYPDPKWRSDGFTPVEFSAKEDCIHPSDAYGAMVLQQILIQIQQEQFGAIISESAAEQAP